MAQVCPKNQQNIYNLNSSNCSLKMFPEEPENDEICFGEEFVNGKVLVSKANQTKEEAKPSSTGLGEEESLSKSELRNRKSLLTQMLRKSQLVIRNNLEIKIPKKSVKKQLCDINCNGLANKKLIQQFEFENYKIGGKDLKKQIRTSEKQCLQCSECQIF